MALTLFILMDYPIHIRELYILCFKGSQVEMSINDVFLSLKIVLSWQTVQTLMKFCLMWHSIWVFTVCKVPVYMYIE